MSVEDIKRKLTATFSADVEGYSRLMGDDELATVQTLTSLWAFLVVSSELAAKQKGLTM